MVRGPFFMRLSNMLGQGLHKKTFSVSGSWYQYPSNQKNITCRISCRIPPLSNNTHLATGVGYNPKEIPINDQQGQWISRYHQLLFDMLKVPLYPTFEWITEFYIWIPNFQSYRFFKKNPKNRKGCELLCTIPGLLKIFELQISSAHTWEHGVQAAGWITQDIMRFWSSCDNEYGVLGAGEDNYWGELCVLAGEPVDLSLMWSFLSRILRLTKSKTALDQKTTCWNQKSCAKLHHSHSFAAWSLIC